MSYIIFKIASCMLTAITFRLKKWKHTHRYPVMKLCRTLHAMKILKLKATINAKPIC